MTTLQPISVFSAMTLAAATLSMGTAAIAQVPIPPSITTPDKVETRIATLDSKDGVPSKTSAGKALDNLDATYAFRAFMDNMRGVSIHALRKAMQDIRAALCRRLRATARRFTRPAGQTPRRKRTQNWIEVGGNVAVDTATFDCRRFPPGNRRD
jgi:hypothetical protein